MKNRIHSILVLALLLLLPAAAFAGFDEDLKNVKDNFGYKIYAGILQKEANSGDKWSNYRLQELQKGIDTAQAGNKFQDTSWWHPIDKVSAGIDVLSKNNAYYDVSKARREYEKQLASVGITAPGQQREQSAVNTLNFLGNFSDAARQGSTMITKSKELEDATYKFNDTSWLHPIDKVTNGLDLLKKKDEVKDQYEVLDRAMDKDPLVKIGRGIGSGIQTISNLFGGNGGSDLLSGLLGGSTPTGNDHYAGGNRSSSSGRIRSNDPVANTIGSDLQRAGQDLSNSIRQISQGFSDIGKAFKTGLSQAGRDLRNSGTCVGPDCKTAPLQLDQVTEKLRSLQIKGNQ